MVEWEDEVTEAMDKEEGDWRKPCFSPSYTCHIEAPYTYVRDLTELLRAIVKL